MKNWLEKNCKADLFTPACEKLTIHLQGDIQSVTRNKNRPHKKWIRKQKGCLQATF